MIFKTQEDVNTYLQYFNRSDEAYENVRNGGVASGVKIEDTGEYRKTRWRAITYLDKRIIVDEFGGIKDAMTHEPLKKVKYKNGGRESWCCMFQDSKGRHVYKRVIQIVSDALLGDKAPPKVKLLIDDIDLPILMNIEVKSDESSRYESGCVYMFDDQGIFEDYCITNDIKCSDDLLKFQAVDDIELVNPSRYEIKVRKSHSKDDLKPFSIKGERLYVSKTGGLYRALRDEGIERLYGRKNKKGIVVYQIGTKPHPTRFNVANIVAKVWGGLDKKRKIHYIDGNPENLCIDNLWWRDCGRDFGYDNV